jgi:xanthine dehydrogenase accessory factor
VYGIALTVAACLQSGTRADVSWLVGADGLEVPDWADAVVLTPGGGKTGSLAGGALDGKLTDLAGRWSSGRLVDLEISQVDALIAELPSPGSARCLLVPADQFPPEVWDLAIGRERFCLVIELSDDEVTGIEVYSDATVAGADAGVREAFGAGVSGSTVAGERIVSVFSALPQIVIVGAGPIAEALARLSALLGWQPRMTSEMTIVSGLIAPLSRRDKVIIAAHDLELAGTALVAALDSDCGYIGSLGSRKMQADRADWLAYRGVTDLTRVHGPAGLDIGAETPGEIAVAIAAEAIAGAAD